MSKFDDALSTYKSAMTEKLGMEAIDESLLTLVTKSLGPSIYLADASLVSCSDQTETDRVKKNFLVGKLGLPDNEELDGAIKSVCDQLGSSNPRKHRAVFYYLLVQHFGKQDLYQPK
jgi:hypothetical protein